MGMGVGRAIDPPLSPSFVRSQEPCCLDARDSLTLSAATIDKDSFDETQKAFYRATGIERLVARFPNHEIAFSPSVANVQAAKWLVSSIT
jgi:hypothetical protein